MDLSTTYLGLRLPHPLMPGASPLVDDLDTVRRLEDAGAAAIVMHSLFEEQLEMEQAAAEHLLDFDEQAFASAISSFPCLNRFALSPDEYLEQIRRIKEATKLPVIASLNGSSPGGWLSFSKMMQEAGADALELNVYYLATDPWESSQDVENATITLLRTLKQHLSIPVSVKLSPYYTALVHFARQLETAGASGLVVFNRFYQPDIDVEGGQIAHRLRLSDSSELLLRLRWLAVLSATIRASLAVSGGVHSAVDAIKAVMAGASAVQMVSALLQKGPQHLGTVRAEMARWLEQHGYDSLHQIQGSLNLAYGPNPRAYERANYLEILQSLKVGRS